MMISNSGPSLYELLKAAIFRVYSHVGPPSDEADQVMEIASLMSRRRETLGREVVYHPEVMSCLAKIALEQPHDERRMRVLRFLLQHLSRLCRTQLSQNDMDTCGVYLMLAEAALEMQRQAPKGSPQ